MNMLKQPTDVGAKSSQKNPPLQREMSKIMKNNQLKREVTMMGANLEVGYKK